MKMTIPACLAPLTSTEIRATVAANVAAARPAYVGLDEQDIRECRRDSMDAAFDAVERSLAPRTREDLIALYRRLSRALANETLSEQEALRAARAKVQAELDATEE
jgi:hypothetical protein